MNEEALLSTVLLVAGPPRPDFDPAHRADFGRVITAACADDLRHIKTPGARAAFYMHWYAIYLRWYQKKSGPKPIDTHETPT